MHQSESASQARACSSLKNELFAPLAARTEFMANLVMIYPIAYK